jgi:hypothetical protein
MKALFQASVITAAFRTGRSKMFPCFTPGALMTIEAGFAFVTGPNLMAIGHDIGLAPWVENAPPARLFTPGVGCLEQAPKKLIDFFDKSLLQRFDFERFLIVRTLPFERKAL